MAIYHLSCKVISRSKGKSSIASSAYRSCEKIVDERTGEINDYTNKKGLEYSEILIPENSLERFKDRKILWNEVEKVEKRKDSQLAKEIEVGLPKELNRIEQIKLLKEFVKDNFINHGMIADINLHDTGDGNPHAHIMLTTRYVDENGFGKKNRDWNDKELLKSWRESWSIKTNLFLEKNNINERVDHRSYEDRGINKIPTIHLGVSAHAMEKKGIKTERGDINREIKKLNLELENLNKLTKFNQNIYDAYSIKLNYINTPEVSRILKGYLINNNISHIIKKIDESKNSLDINIEDFMRETPNFKKDKNINSEGKIIILDVFKLVQPKYKELMQEAISKVEDENKTLKPIIDKYKSVYHKYGSNNYEIWGLEIQKSELGNRDLKEKVKRFFEGRGKEEDRINIDHWNKQIKKLKEESLDCLKKETNFSTFPELKKELEKIEKKYNENMDFISNTNLKIKFLDNFVSEIEEYKSYFKNEIEQEKERKSLAERIQEAKEKAEERNKERKTYREEKNIHKENDWDMEL